MYDIIASYVIMKGWPGHGNAAIDGRTRIQKRTRAAGGKKPLYTPRPKSQIVLAWVLLAIVIFAIGGMCYWQIFGKF